METEMNNAPKFSRESHVETELTKIQIVVLL